MRHSMWVGALGALWSGVAFAEPAADKPKVKDVQALVGRGGAQALVKAMSSKLDDDVSWKVSHVIGEVGDGVFVAIGIVTDPRTEAEIEEEKAGWQGWEGSYAEAFYTPFVAVVRRGPDGALQVIGGAPLPTSETPHADLAWGFSKVEDVDGDGKNELAVVHGYRSFAPGSTFGEVKLKEISWLSVGLDGAVSVQAHLVTELVRGGLETAELVTKYRFVERPGTSIRDLRVTREEDGEKSTVLWVWDAAKDVWAAPVR